MVACCVVGVWGVNGASSRVVGRFGLVALLVLVGLGSLTDGLVAGIIPVVWAGTLGDCTLVPSDVFLLFKEQECTATSSGRLGLSVSAPLLYRY